VLPDADAVESVLFGDGPPPFAPGAVWAQMGTIGVTATTGLAGRLGLLRPNVTFVDAPASGSRSPAEAGQLLILASGPASAEPVTSAAFAAIGRSARHRRQRRPPGRGRPGAGVKAHPKWSPCATAVAVSFPWSPQPDAAARVRRSRR
jgi:3-hydroxyisobutyrate dehydrogenase-like beta-hydroxyacid dehydrogenase